MQFILNANLKSYHTFGINQTCDALVEVSSVEQVIEIYQSDEWKNSPKLIVGKGSNILFTEHFNGLVIVNRIVGKTVSETDEYFHLHVNGGEDWPELVSWTIQQSMGGLENLAMIPGCAGSAPIQNIGAYGLELKELCEYVDYLCLDSLEVIRLTAAQCNFSYRNSVFKESLLDKAFVVGIGLKINKEWEAINDYGPLKVLPETEISPEGIYNAVCSIRSSKLPDPKVFGNAGSFFKNPMIARDQYDQLKALHPEMVGYPSLDMVKVAAGWLIEHSGLKGISFNGAQVHPNQALVLINKNNASADDIIQLAHQVRLQVSKQYQITLEHEVRFMNAYKETNLSQIWEARA